MERSDERILKALHRIKADPELKPILDWLQTSLESQQIKNDRIVDEVSLRWGQGKAQLLTELLSTIDTARATAEKIST